MKQELIVYGISNSHDTAQIVVTDLKKIGFLNHDILVIFKSPIESKEFADQNHINTSEDSETNIYSGIAIGGFLGWLAMAGFAEVAVPVIGGFIIAGPILTALIGAEIANSIDNLTDVLLKLGIDKEHAAEYEHQIKAGGVFLLVNAKNSEEFIKAKEAFTSNQTLVLN